MRLPEDQARAIALMAAARGWLKPEDLWEAACRWNNGESAARLLERRLDADQIAALESELGDRTPLYLDSSLMVSPAPLSSREREHRSAPSLDPVASEGAEGAEASRDPGRQPGLVTGSRYRTRSLLGEGGVGQVLAARDREIGRRVALKTLRSQLDSHPRLLRKFLIEARVTAQLEHPNIVPVYDMGITDEGTPFYTMRIVNQQSLAAVLRQPQLRSEWSLARLLGAFVQVSRALGYAHSRGVLHGDIKPENILLGDFGEVYLADWGLTKVAPHSPVRTTRHESSAPPPESIQPVEGTGSMSSLLSQLRFDKGDERPSRPGGTPGYVAPEVAYGDWSKIDHRADLFALGVVLFEILAERRPFEGRDATDVILNTVTKEPPRPRELNPSCPLLLEDLCLELLEKERESRPDSADHVAERVESYMEGAKEKERRRQEAARLCTSAREPVERFEALMRQQRELAKTAREMLLGIEGWEPVERKGAAWDISERATVAEREGARALAQAIDLFTKALGYDAGSRAAHRGLAELYWARACDAERERRHASRIYFETLTLEHDIDGHFAAMMSAPATVVIESDPPGAEVIAERYRESDRMLVPFDEERLGTTPVTAKIEQGSYRITLRAEGKRDVRYPVLLDRGSHHEARVRLFTDAEIGEGFIHVPAGTAIIGGDPEAFDALEREEVFVADFAIQEFPVTMREYCAFLGSLPEDEALKRAPHDKRGSEGLAVHRRADGSWEPSDFIIEGPARELFPIEEGHLWQVPAVLLDWFDARAYCQWRSARDGCAYRLPTEHEWEKAARGADGRFFPWGDRFDPTFCKMRDSRSFTHQPEPIGTFAGDVSPYGVRDMAGGMREWVGDIAGELSAEEAWSAEEPTESTDRGESSLRMIRGGAWSTPLDWCRGASRTSMFALARGTGLTMRLAKTLG